MYKRHLTCYPPHHENKNTGKPDSGSNRKNRQPTGAADSASATTALQDMTRNEDGSIKDGMPDITISPLTWSCNIRET